MSASITVALAGNPNAGKSTIFNALTGSQQHVGNWPGKTVEKKEGRFQINNLEVAIVDLPGTYSLTAFSVEEIITRDYIVEEKPDAVVAVVDAANLERNLYLVVQLLEMNVPVILALNMVDVAERRQIVIDQQKLSALLGNIPVISTVGNREIGLDELKEQLTHIRQHASVFPQLCYQDDVEREIAALQQLIEADANLNSRYESRWLAVKLLEADEGTLSKIQHHTVLATQVQNALERVQADTGDDPETWIADRRYEFIDQIIQRVVSRPDMDLVTTSDRIDSIVTHRVWGLPIFLLMMWFVFQITANASAPFLDWIDSVINGPVARWAGAMLNAVGLDGTWIEALLLDGMIASVGAVLVFIPVLCSLYLVIALLEDSGYMARAAFVMDRLMSALGLHGKSFLPLLVGFGCTVPAIYATRTLENEHDRKITAFLTTFMSCGARLPVYVVFGAAFFGAASGGLIFAMYMIGIAMAILTSLLLTKLVFRNKPIPPFVLELPPYRVPGTKAVFKQTWQRTVEFLKHAGTVILVMSIIIWLLLAIPAGEGKFSEVEPENSVFGQTSKLIAPAFAPAGYGEWEASGSLITGLVAKEVVIASMSQIYTGVEDEAAAEDSSFMDDIQQIGAGFGEAAVLTVQEVANIVPRTLNLIPGLNLGHLHLLGDEAQEIDTGLEVALGERFTPLTAVAFNTFILLYVPCMSATAAMRQEFGTRWMLVQVVYTLGIAWLAAVLVYQVGSLLGF